MASQSLGALDQTAANNDKAKSPVASRKKDNINAAKRILEQGSSVSVNLPKGNVAMKKLNQDTPIDFDSYEQDTEAYGLGVDGKYGYGKYKIGRSVDSLKPMPVRMHPSPSKALREPAGEERSGVRPR